MSFGIQLENKGCQRFCTKTVFCRFIAEDNAENARIRGPNVEFWKMQREWLAEASENVQFSPQHPVCHE